MIVIDINHHTIAFKAFIAESILQFTMYESNIFHHIIK